ncbi:MAG: hypothetical protein IK053_01770 [Muribaculaceae bacterium]|nr:hypothetical protein [Muribaculaceae bacterium]
MSNQQNDLLAVFFNNYCVKRGIPVEEVITYLYDRLNCRQRIMSAEESSKKPTKWGVVYEVLIPSRNEHFYFKTDTQRDLAFNALSASNLQVYKSAETMSHHTDTFFWDNQVDELVKVATNSFNLKPLGMAV